MKTKLPEPMMKAIRVLLDPEVGLDEELSAVDRLQVVLLMVHGYGQVEKASLMGPLDPTETEIPVDQWTEIAQAMVDASKAHGGVTSVNMALDWMNSGPSAYTEVPTP